MAFSHVTPRALLQRLPVFRDERAAVSILFLHYLLVSAAVIAAKSVRDAFFLSAFSKSAIPRMYIVSALSLTIAMFAFSWLARHVKERSLVLGSLLLFSASLVPFYFWQTRTGIAVFYVWVEIIASVIILHAWLLNGSAFNPQQAKRLFGLIAAGGSLAALVGGAVTSWVSTRFGSSSILLLVLALLACAAVSAHYAFHLAADPAPSQPATPLAPAKIFPLGHYLLTIATLVGAAAIVSSIAQYRFQSIAAASFPDRSQLVAFFGTFYSWAGFISLLSQLFLSSFLLARFGVFAGLAVLPLAFLTGSISVAFSPTLWLIGINRFADVSFKFTLNNSALEMLWLPVPAGHRRAVKPFVSSTIKACAEGLAAVLLVLLANQSSSLLLNAIAIATTSVWIAAVVRIRFLYPRELAKVIAKRQLDTASLTISTTDPAVLSLLQENLRHGSLSMQISAIGFLEGFPLAPFKNTLQTLYAQPDPELRDAVLRVAAEDRSILEDSAILSAMHDPALAATAAKVASLRSLRAAVPLLLDRCAATTLDPSLDAAIALAGSSWPEREQGQARLAQWLNSSSPGELTLVLRQLPVSPTLVSVEQLRRYLGSLHRPVRQATLDLISRSARTELRPEVIHALADPLCHFQARAALQSFPAADNADALQQLIASGPNSASLAALRALKDYLTFVNEASLAQAVPANHFPSWIEFLKLLHRLALLRPLQSLPPALFAGLQERVLAEAFLIDFYRSSLEADPSAILLRDNATVRFLIAQELALRLAAFRYPRFPIDACLQSLRTGSGSTPFAIELVESVLDRDTAHKIVTLLNPDRFEERLLLVTKNYSGQSLSFEEQLEKSASSQDPWEATIVRHYLHLPLQSPIMISTLERTIQLKSSSLFSAIPAENLTPLAAIAEVLNCPSGHTIFADGTPSDYIYIITAGSVSVSKNGTVIAELHHGDCFGEMGVLDNSPRAASLIAASEVELLRIDAERFLDLLAATPALSLGVLQILAARLRHADQLLAL